MKDPFFPNPMRPPIAGLHGAVASAHPLASQAGFDMLRGGGNAIDAVTAMAIALGVAEPYMSGPGGVGFLLYHPADGQTTTLNFSGNTPQQAAAKLFTPESQDAGPRACLIPGNVAGWCEAIEKHGRLPLAKHFEHAIALADEGFPLHPFNTRLIEMARPRLNPPGQEVFGPLKLRIGEILRQPDLAQSYRHLAEHGPEYFYRGPLAEQISNFIQAEGGFLSAADLADYQPEWETPIAADYRGLTVKTCPPNNEGFQVLETLRLLEAFDLNALGQNSADYIHLLSECIKLAVADRLEYGGDPKFDDTPVEKLFEQAFVEERRNQINFDRASLSEGERWNGFRQPEMVAPGRVDGLTTHMAAVDSEGNVASITQSLGNGFGSGVMVPGTGIVLNNFVWWMETDANAPSRHRLQPGKRWSSCMAPLHVFRDDQFWFSISTPGSWGILQTSLQMLLNIVEFGADPQQAIEAPRFRVWENTKMQIENRVPESVRDQLTSRGHELELIGDYSVLVGGGHSVMIDPDSGARIAGADPRRDGYALAY